VRRLDQNAGPVAGVGLTTARAAAVQVQQHLQRLLNYGMGLPALDVDHETHSAGFMLEPRIVKTLFGRRTGPGHATATAIDVCSIRHSQESQISRQTVTKVA